MATRKPLVIAGGIVQQLQAGDTLEGVVAPGGLIPGGRITLLSDNALPITDQTAVTTIRYVRFTHSYIDLFDGSAWQRTPFVETSIAVPTTTNTNFDVFGYLNAGNLGLETVNWTNNTTRATDITRQNGYWVKVGDNTRLYLGTARTTGTSGQCEDSLTKRYVWNAYNRVARLFDKTFSGAGYTYSTATFRQANADANNKIEFVSGIQNALLDVDFAIYMQTTVATAVAAAAIGFDATGPGFVGKILATELGVANSAVMHHAKYQAYPAVGYHFVTGLERGAGSGTQTWTSSSDRGLLGFLQA